MNSKIVFLFPSATRPAKFANTIQNITEMCITDNYEIVCICEESDLSMNNDAVKQLVKSYPKVSLNYITSTGKINAINQGLNYLPEDYQILVLMADDIQITVKGFESFVVEDMNKYFPKLDGCIHYPDGIMQVGDRQITVPILGRKLIERFNYIYHPSYISCWCDNEMLQTYKQIDKVKYINRLIWIHNHPAWGKAAVDELYKKNESFYHTDSDNYFKRMAVNFDL